MNIKDHFKKMHSFYDKFTFWLSKNCNSKERIEGLKFKPTYKQCNSFIIKLLELENKNINFYDFGCGIGKPTLDIAKKFNRVNFTLINSNLNHLKYIKKTYKLKNFKLLKKDYHNTGLKTNSADIIMFSESYSHSYNRVKLLKELKRILKPRGKVLIIDWFAQDTYSKNQWDAFVESMSMYLEKPVDTIKRFNASNFKLIYKNINCKNYLKVINKKYDNNYFFYKNKQLSDFGEMVKELVETDANISIPAILLFQLQK